jgi:hypothetical protein
MLTLSMEKLQAPKKLQDPKRPNKQASTARRIEARCLKILWRLELGVWSLVRGQPTKGFAASFLNCIQNGFNFSCGK